jgi:PBP1b-binding outer membrane lipoprotein LpoB
MKKIISVILILALTLTLSGCVGEHSALTPVFKEIGKIIIWLYEKVI